MGNLRKRVFAYLNEAVTEFGLDNVRRWEAYEIAKNMAEFEPGLIARTGTMWAVEKRANQLRPHVETWLRYVGADTKVE